MGKKSTCTYPYIPNSAPEIKAYMLQQIGVLDVETLYQEIPEASWGNSLTPSDKDPRCLESQVLGKSNTLITKLSRALVRYSGVLPDERT